MSDNLILRIDDFVLYTERNDINPTVFGVYCESDKRIIPIPSREPETAEEEDGDGDESFVYEPEGPTQRVEYTVGAQAALDRLELIGCTLSEAKRHFDDDLAELVAALHTWSERAETAGADFKQYADAREAVIRSLTFDLWLDGFRHIYGTQYQGDFRFDWWKPEYEGIPLHVRYMLSEGSDGRYGFPVYDCRSYLRAAFEVTGTTGQVTLDLTDMVYGESVDPDEEMCSWSRRQLADNSVVNHKIIVLTEGKTDKAVLEGAFRLLYPHLVEFYSFTDFDGAKASGGAGAQVSTLKAFVGAGVVNRIIAIFDNDTAAKVATRSLRDVRLPETVRVLLYPDLDLARSYPTLGPQGIFSMDVNGLAAGIELYLGKDVLRQDDGTLTPVQWRGYDQSIKQYQGEVLNKDELHKKFTEKLEACQADRTKITDYDWSGVRSILTAIRTAFASK